MSVPNPNDKYGIHSTDYSVGQHNVQRWGMFPLRLVRTLRI